MRQNVKTNIGFDLVLKIWKFHGSQTCSSKMNSLPNGNLNIKKRFRLRANVAIAVIVLLVPVVIHGARSSVDGMRITPEKWASPENPQRQLFDRFRHEFEGNDVVYVSWEGCTLDDPRLAKLETSLLQGNKLAEIGVIPFERVVTGAGTVQQMTERPLSLSRSDAAKRLEGFLVGPDQRTSCAVVVLTYDGNEHRRESIAHLLEITKSTTGLNADSIVIAGPPHDGVAIDDESVRGVNLFGALSTLVAAIFCFYCLRSWRIAGVILGLACLGQGIVLAGIYYAGYTLDAVLIVAPPLIFVLTVSAGIHFVNYYRAQPETIDVELALRNAWAEGWKPCVLATLTTAVGLCSLSVSRVTPIAVFGGFSAAGLILTVTLLMCVLPDAIMKWPVSRRTTGQRNTSKSLNFLSQWVPAYPGMITGTFAILIVCTLLGMRHMRTSVDVTSLFGKETKILRDYHWLESNIGASVPVEVIVRFDQNSNTNISEQIDVVKRIHSLVEDVDGIHAAMSAVTFLPDRASSGSGGRVMRQALVNKRLHSARSSLDSLNYYFEDEQKQSWRVTGRAFATEGLSYGEIGQRITSRVDQLLSSKEFQDSGIQVQFSGMMPLIENIQVMILNDLFRSLLTAFAFIGICILLVLRDFKVAALVTILNTFPVIVIFGLMGGASIPIDIGTMMTAGVAMGIAVDDTIHFLCFYRNRVAETRQPVNAIKESIQTCGAAMLQTTLICAMGMLVFALSAFVPTKQFGLIMAAILGAAVVCDLVCLPALLLLISRRQYAEEHSQLHAPEDSTSQSLPVPAAHSTLTS